MSAALIGFDWGTTNLRAALLSADGRVLDERRGASGVGQLDPAGFAARFAEHVAGWPPLPALLAGMVGSAQGWRDAGYVSVPAGPDELAERMAPFGAGPETGLGAGFEHDGRSVAIVPGISQNGDGRRPDVMRGEETQLVGLLAERPDFHGTAVLPGTHSKWVVVADGAVQTFATHMTGDLFEALRSSTILRHSVGEGDAPGSFRDAFLSAFALGASAWGQLFGIRAATLLQGATLAQGRETLSGLLIGAEFAAARADGHLDGAPLALIGSGALVERYAQAAALAGVEATTHDGAPLVWRALAALARARSLV